MKFFVGLLVLAGMSVSAAVADVKIPYKVVCTTGMIGDVVRSISGDRGSVVTLMGEGVDPHLYKPTRDDVAKLLSADIAFYNGLLLEGRMSDVFPKIAGKGIPVYAVTEKLDEKYLIEPSHGHPDPHVWMDVEAWKRTVPVIRDALTKLDPAGAETYAGNALKYEAELDQLNAYVAKVIAAIPPEQRVLVTAHDAFNYFARAYKMEVKGIQGISTESEAGVADINNLVGEIITRKIPAIFVESSVSDKNVRAVQEGAAARGFPLKLGGQLYSDAMGKPGTYEGTYMGMIDHNATIISRALGGNAPEGGMQNLLKP